MAIKDFFISVHRDEDEVYISIIQDHGTFRMSFSVDSEEEMEWLVKELESAANGVRYYKEKIYD